MKYPVNISQDQARHFIADTPPPALTQDDERWEGKDPRYAKLKSGDAPLTECLKDTVARVLPFWSEAMAPAIRAGKRIVVTAHGNSIRAMVKYLDNISDEDIVGLNIPNGIPLVYELDDDHRPTEPMPVLARALGDPEAVRAAAEAVKNQAART